MKCAMTQSSLLFYVNLTCIHSDIFIESILLFVETKHGVAHKMHRHTLCYVCKTRSRFWLHLIRFGVGADRLNAYPTKYAKNFHWTNNTPSMSSLINISINQYRCVHQYPFQIYNDKFRHGLGISCVLRDKHHFNFHTVSVNIRFFFTLTLETASDLFDFIYSHLLMFTEILTSKDHWDCWFLGCVVEIGGIGIIFFRAIQTILVDAWNS